MKRWSIFLLLFVFVVIGAFFAWRFLPPGQTYFSDANTIKEPVATAQVRDVLWEPPVPLTEPINMAGESYEPRLSNDGMTLYFVRGKAGSNADIYFSRRTVQGWSDPQLIAEINSLADDLGPEISADGESLYFYSNRSGGQGGYDLWVSRRGTDGAWRQPANLGPQINSQFNDYGPALTSDARMLYFSSNRPQPGDQREPDPSAWPATLREEFYTRTYDLYLVALTDSGAGKVEPLSALNTLHNEGAPAVSSFGDFLYFASDRPGGSGGFDLYRSRRLRDEIQPPISLGRAVNTASHELDPALSMNGFGLDFSSNRPAQGQGADAAHEYKLYHTNSREVFSKTEHLDRVPIDWAALWRAVGPNLLWALLALAILLVMFLLFKGSQNRKLNLLTKCVLASLAAHLLLMLLFNVWEVAASVAGEIRGNGGGGGIRVALSPSGGSGIASQIGGSLSEMTVPSAHLDSIRAPAVVESPLPLSHVNVPLQKAVLEIQSSRAVEMRAHEATTPSQVPALPDVAPQIDVSPPRSIALNVPSVPSVTPTTEAVIQLGSAQTSGASQQSTLPASTENSAIASPAAPPRMQLPVSTGLTPGRIADSVRDAVTAVSGTQNESMINLQLPASATAYRVSLASHLPEAPISGGAAMESKSSVPAISIGGSARQAANDRIEGTPFGNQAEWLPGLAHADLTGFGATRLAPGLLLGAKDSELPSGIGVNENGYSGNGLAGTALSTVTASKGAASKGYASLNLALPEAGRSVSNGDSEKDGAGPMRVGVPSATRAPLSNELAGSQVAASKTVGTSESSLPRANVFSASGPGNPGSPSGAKSATTLASLTREASPGGYKPEGGTLVSSLPTTAAAAFDLNLPTDLAPPENPYPQSAEGRLNNDSAGQDEIVGAIRGTVTNKATRVPLASAQVRLVLSDRETLAATTDSAGKYTLDVPAATPDFFALSASRDEFVPQTRSIERARLEGKKKMVVNFALEPQSQNALATEATPDVHHLGDDRFSGDINSQFQKKSEGAKFSIGFEIAHEILANPLARAEVRLMVKGVQRRHKLFVNRKLLGRRLDEAPEDGGFGEFIAPFDPAILVPGINSLRIEALPSDSDIDDFEFVNIRIYLVPSAGPDMGAGGSLKTDARPTGTQ